MTSVSTIHRNELGDIVQCVSTSATGARITNSHGEYVDITVDGNGDFTLDHTNAGKAYIEQVPDKL